jgi:hypothetical protein
VPQRWPLAAAKGQPCRAENAGRDLLGDSTRELKAFTKLCARRFARQADAEAELARLPTG